MQPTPRHRAGQPLVAGIHGLAGGWPYPHYVAIVGRELLPHVFTLTLAGGYFLLRFARNYSRLWFPQSLALSCPDFPPRYNRSDRATHHVAKVGYFFISLRRINSAWGCPYGLRSYPFHLIRIMPAKGKRP